MARGKLGTDRDLAGRGELDGVGEHVAEDLQQPSGVPLDMQTSRRLHQVNFDVFHGGALAHGVDGWAHQVRQIMHRHVERDLVARHTIEVEQVVDELDLE